MNYTIDDDIPELIRKICKPLKNNMKLVTLKGSSTSGNHGHSGRPGHVGGSAPTDNTLSEAQRLTWHNNVNIATYGRLSKMPHGHLLENVLLNVTWSDMTREQFIATINEVGVDVPKADKNGDDVQKLLYGMMLYVRENGTGSSAIDIPTLSRLSNMTTRDIDYVYSYKGFDKFAHWEATHGLNQLRLHRNVALDKNNGFVSTQDAIRSAANRFVRHNNYGKLYDYIQSLR